MRRFLRLLALGAVLSAMIGLLPAGPAPAAPVTMRPGTAWTDTAGARLQAHGAGVFQVGSTYYLVGEDKAAGATFTAVACYSSTDLVNWTRQGNALSRQSSGDLTADRIVERPKVLYNATTKLYVMWMHIDQPGYPDGRAGVATSDGTAYLMSEDRASGLRIDRLSADYLTATTETAVLPNLESPAMVKVNGRYFLFASHLTGWNTNDNVYATATSPTGPWSSFSTFAPVGTNTFNSQTSYVLPVSGTAGTSYVYIGDRWKSTDLYNSAQVRLPLTISGSTASMNTFYGSWSIDAVTCNGRTNQKWTAS
jgi:hypothetical protein